MSPRSATILVAHPGAELFGSDRMLLESVRGLVESGSRVVVAVPGEGPLIDELSRSGAEVWITPMFVLRKSLMAPRKWPLLIVSALRGLIASWRLLGEVAPDAVYVSTIIVPQWPLLARLRGKRSVSHVHEAEAAGSRILSALLYLPHLASQRTLVNSLFCRAAVRRALPVLVRRCHVVLNGVEAPVDPTPPRDDLDGRIRVLYLGRLSPRKGPDLVIEAASRLRSAGRDVSVTLVGAVFAGYEWFEQQLRDQASRTGVQVDFAGFREDVWPFLDQSDVLVVPSRLDESFGNTAVEGILALRPVIASDSSGLREAVGDCSTARLVRVDDADAISGALQEMIDDWDRLVRDASGNRSELLRRHAPATYRAAVAREVLGGLR